MAISMRLIFMMKEGGSMEDIARISDGRIYLLEF